jgi:alkanesulfonate monooxygenase SsuD/methylene tetrahydromethanopterin reductase-like flavin-dependent oxidoreductase (luciferase family)
MKYGFVMPGGDAGDAVAMGIEAERAGWDGLFCYEPTWGVDAWVCLTAVAMRTERIRLGTMLTPLPKRKPWEVGSQVATLDRLSNGRVILSVGLGAPDDRFYMFEDDPGRKVRAEMLDEGLAMLALMYRGEPFEYAGTHYHAHRPDRMIPPPTMQRPRVPTWVAGLYGAARSMRRAAAWDGWLPNYREPDGHESQGSPEALAAGIAWLREQRARMGLGMDGYDVVVEGITEPDEINGVRRWAQAGATWWLEANWEVPEDRAVQWCLDRLRAGPPRG